eukprot:m51a1_g12731 putative bzip transcription factor domain containing protein (223) ;mRNA; r:2554-3533
MSQPEPEMVEPMFSVYDQDDQGGVPEALAIDNPAGSLMPALDFDSGIAADAVPGLWDVKIEFDPAVPETSPSSSSSTTSAVSNSPPSAPAPSAAASVTMEKSKPKPKSRGRKRSCPDTSPDAPKREDEDEDERALKKQRRLMRNREAAAMFRERQKQYITDLETRVMELTGENGSLARQVQLQTTENQLARDNLERLRENGPMDSWSTPFGLSGSLTPPPTP